MNGGHLVRQTLPLSRRCSGALTMSVYLLSSGSSSLEMQLMPSREEEPHLHAFFWKVCLNPARPSTDGRCQPVSRGQQVIALNNLKGGRTLQVHH